MAARRLIAEIGSCNGGPPMTLYRINEDRHTAISPEMIGFYIDYGVLVPVEPDAGILLCLDCKSEALPWCGEANHEVKEALAFIDDAGIGGDE